MYNLLGGTRYGTEPGDLGDDIELALVDICDPVVQVLPSGEERLWFWLEVTATGQPFEYYAWGVPDQDIYNPNANEWRDPVDPLWGYSAFEITSFATSSSYWSTERGELCPLGHDDLPGIRLFVDSEYGFRIPVGMTRAAWVCVRMGQGQPLPESTLVSIRPQLARITRWVDRLFEIRGEETTAAPGQATSRGYLLPASIPTARCASTPLIRTQKASSRRQAVHTQPGNGRRTTPHPEALADQDQRHQHTHAPAVMVRGHT